jgi:hypothetical protein
MQISFQNLTQRLLGASVATVLTLFVSGCGLGAAGGSSSGAGPVTTLKSGKIAGNAFGGQQPVTGSVIQLYEVGGTWSSSTDGGYTSGIAKPLISSSNQTGGVGSVAITGGVSGTNVTAAGTGYTSAPGVVFSPPPNGGSIATGTAVLSGNTVGSITINSAGSGYTSAPTITFTCSSCGGSGAAATATFAVTGGGAGYTSAPTVTFSAPVSGTTATGTAVLSSGSVASVTITNPGSGYTTAPTVSFNCSSCGGSGAAAASLIVGSGNALTDAGGNFNITGDYNCDSGSYVYITGSGGNPGNGVNNPNIALMAALGPCSVLKSEGNAGTYPFIFMDEETTVAAAYALAQFSGNTTFGTPLSSLPGTVGSSPTAPADNFTTSYSNQYGIANAMAIAGVLVNTTTGTSPGNNANGTATVEYWQVNLLSNLLAACINSQGNTGAGSPCGTLYANVINNGTAPADTIQAAVLMAKNPVLSATQISNLYGLIPAAGPFQPYPTATTQIHDMTLAIAYNPQIPGTTAGTLADTLLTDPQAVTFDQYGNAWFVMEQGSTSVDNWIAELDPTGNPIPAGCTSSCTSASNYEITTYSLGTSAGSNGTSTTYEGPLSTTNYLLGIAFDTSNNLWVTDWSQGNVMVVPGSGAVYTSSGTASTYNGGNYNGSNGATSAYGYAVGSGGGTRPTGLAIDGSNDVFITTTGGSYETDGTGYTNTAYTSGGSAKPYKGFVTFVGGSASNVSYAAVSDAPTQVAISSGTLDKVSGTAITGSPFVWMSTSGFALLDQAYSQPTTVTGAIGTGQGMLTPFSANTAESTYGIGGANQTGIWTTVPNSAGSLFPAVTSDAPTSMIATSNLNAITTDGYGNVWASSLTNTVDSGAVIKDVITKITPSYTTPTYSTTAGAYDGDFSFVIYHDIAGMNSGQTGTAISARALATDGGGNIWFGLSGGFIGAITGSGTAISPNYTSGTTSGFVGSTTSGSECTNVCYFTGTTTGYSRTSIPKQIQVDLSGNVWAPSQHAAYPNLTVLVGAGVPLASPSSSALAAGKYGLQP